MPVHGKCYICGDSVMHDPSKAKRNKNFFCSVEHYSQHRRQNRKRYGRHRFKHGMAKTRIHIIYLGMVGRCTNKKSRAYPRYGGRGIKVEWSSFESFYKDMGQSYLEHIADYGEKNTSIDRIDNDGNYCRENCRWATNKEQANNTSKNIFIEWDGHTRTISEWSDAAGIPAGTIRNRIYKGWPTRELFKALKTNNGGS